MNEIIHVVDPANAFDTLRRGLEIAPVNGQPNDQPLAAGYYFVLWPTGRKAASRKRGKRYFGPFRTHAEARLLRTSALILGLAQEEAAAPALAACRSTVRHAPAANDWTMRCTPPRRACAVG
ncbi:MAG: hypothetical protein PHY45_00580 [Rhodocyclaceae bacterium]|nr:hypothetical protein [Rhodocyclaceae bacterium]